ncbi:MAG: NAD(P)H-dependent glycerol-3-phosphate dehydrogenase [Bacilli bacterium]|nr:NAD(P)H-dependent glycerol-3-phosphate dehydrogenase [Bacilli bacterium]
MKITILGAGAYALALSSNIKNEHKIVLWTKFIEEKDLILNTGGNDKVLPGYKVGKNVSITTNMEEAVKDSNLIIVAVPAPVVDDVTKELKKYLKRNQHICIASKGIDEQTYLFVYDIFTRIIKTRNVSVISGPSFAIDMCNHNPIGLTLATRSKKTKEIVLDAFDNSSLKIRTTRDVIGVEICGSIKNVLAIGAGILNGMGYSESTQAMFITESLHDIKGLIRALGGNPKTILSYAGFGDLMLTATSSKSRNYKFGVMLGKRTDKNKLNEYINSTTVEGINTLNSIYKLLKKKKVDMKIIDLLHDIIYKNKDIDYLVNFLINKN